MKKNLFVLVLLTCFANICVTAWRPEIKDNCMTVNLTDSLGRRFGLCSDYGSLNFYKEGRQAGTWVLFEESRSPDSIMYLAMAGYSFDHKEKGSLIFFNPNGVVSCMLVNITENKDFIGSQKNFTSETPLPYQSYGYEFYEDGRIKAEGWVILCEDILVDGGERVGIWKFYTPTKKIEEVDFSKEDNDCTHSRLF